MNGFENQVVLIAGAKGGLGSAITQAFLDAGATVAGSSRSIQDADFQNPRFAAIPADLTVPDSAGFLVTDVIRRFGRIDALVHVVGGFAGGMSVPETTDETWDLMLNLNLRSALHLLRVVIPQMRQAKRGRIVAIASRQAAEPSAYTSAYNASKAALVALIRTVALENQDAGITANTILPGAMNTEANRQSNPGTDPSKWVQTAQVAAVATFLASDASASITGAAIPVYGPAI